MENDNLNETEAVEETITSDEAVAEAAPVDSPDTQPVTEASTETTSTEPLIDGKFRTEADRDNSYQELQRKFHEQAGQLSELRRRVESAPQPAQVVPKHKELEKDRNAWYQQYRNAATDEQRAQADEQVRLYDRAIAKEEAKYEFQQQSTRQTAEQQLETESVQVLQQYQDDLNNMSSPLYQAAAARHQQLRAAGHPDTNATKALAVTYAAATTGVGLKATAQAVQKDRGQLLKTLNVQAKRAVQAGAGGPAVVKSGTLTGKDIEQMSEKEFAAYERRLLGV